LTRQTGILQHLFQALAVEFRQFPGLGLALGLQGGAEGFQPGRAVLEGGQEALAFLLPPFVPEPEQGVQGFQDGGPQPLRQVGGGGQPGARQPEERLGGQGRQVEPFGVLLPGLGHGPQQRAV